MPVVHRVSGDMRFRVFTRAGVIVLSNGRVFHRPRFNHTQDSRFTGTVEEISRQEFRYMVNWDNVYLVMFRRNNLVIWFRHHDLELRMHPVHENMLIA